MDKDHTMELKKVMFRGQSNVGFKLTPSLGRRPSPTYANSLTTVEHQLIRFARQKFPIQFSETDHPVILLAKLQHYGVPTRMLDITENAFVALYFACNNNEDVDGAVFVFEAELHSAYDPIANAIADTYQLTENAVTPLENYYFRALHRPYMTRWLYPEWESDIGNGAKRFLSEVVQPLFIETGYICERQKNQGGHFILFPNEIPESCMCVRDALITMGDEDKCIVKKIIVKKEAKREIINQLKRFGISRETLFSDSIDEVLKGVLEEQKSRYF